MRLISLFLFVSLLSFKTPSRNPSIGLDTKSLAPLRPPLINPPTPSVLYPFKDFDRMPNFITKRCTVLETPFTTPL